MDYSSIKAGLESFVERYDSQTFIGSYRETNRSSLLNDGLSTRANSLWKMAEYVVAKYDNTSYPIDNYIKGWRQLASGANNQYLLLEESKAVWAVYNAQGERLGGEDYIRILFEKKKKQSSFSNNTKNVDVKDSPQPIQQIYYGAPGTGKSDTIFERTKDLPKEDVFRTTFHPDSDYASFVGSYKPKMNDRTVYGAQGPLRNSRGEEISEPKITYTFSPQAFTNAYIRAWQTDEPVFLIIEEINRGNCAQIFGDLFQLLDRDEYGYSKYEIVADSDLADCIKEKLNNAGEKECLTSDIKEGKILKLPNNLYIWATMNTSDQSLFPIDSAFKRRWEWKYIKIKKGINKKTKQELDWKIKVGEENYDWWEFVNRINDKIAKMTSSADKQLGYFFCLADGKGEISADTFVNKVAFYLWNDVFKDYAEDGSPLLKYKKKEEDKSESDLTFPDFFDERGEIDSNVVKQFVEKVMKEDEMDKPAE